MLDASKRHLFLRDTSESYKNLCSYKKMMDTLVLLAEFLGAFLLTLSVFASGGTWWVIGGTLALIVLLIGRLSGGHVNPAISVAVYMKGALSLNELLAYVVAQIAGSVASLYVFRVFS